MFYGKSLIPRHYISNDTVRLSFYTKINKAETKEDLDDIKDALLDRFGGLPSETKSFMGLALVKLLYKNTIVKNIVINGGSVVFEILEENVGKNTVNNVLGYKNRSIINKSFKEGPSSLLVEFTHKEGFGWFPFLIDCNSVFYVT